MTTDPYTPSITDLIVNPAGSAAGYVVDRGRAATDRLAGFATDRFLDIGGTLILALLGVSIAMVGVLRIFAAGSQSKTGGALIDLASLRKPR